VATQVHAGPHDETDLMLDRRGLRRVWIIGFVLMFLTIATWSLAMPLSAAPDEPAQYIKAAAVVRGNFGSRPSAQPGVGLVRAPHFFGTAALNPACFAFGPNTTASCVRAVIGPGDDRIDDVPTGAAPYPPLYYLLVGAPLLSAPSFTALYVARLLSAAVSAAFLASAFVAAAEGRRRRLPVLGVLIAATPTIYFFAGAVNPAGFEATTAICLWASLLRLAQDGGHTPGWQLPARIAVSGSALAFCRGLSPAWVAAILGLVLVGTRWRDLWALLARRAVRAALLVVVAAAAVAQVYIRVAHTITLIAGPPVTLTDAAIWRVSAGHSGLWLHQMIAQLGWQTPTPLLAVVAWIAAVGCVLLIGAAAAGVRMRLAIVATTVATAVLPIVAEATTARQSGFIWQGRYLLPIAVGVPLLAGFALARHPGDGADARRLAGAVSSVVGVGSLAAFYAALRRHMVGVDGPLNPLTPLPASWQPPVPATLLVLGFVLLTMAVCGWVTYLAGTAAGQLDGISRGPQITRTA